MTFRLFHLILDSIILVDFSKKFFKDIQAIFTGYWGKVKQSQPSQGVHTKEAGLLSVKAAKNLARLTLNGSCCSSLLILI